MTKKPPRANPTDQDQILRYSFGKTTLGRILVASSDKGVVSVLIGDSSEQLLTDLQLRFPSAHLMRDDVAAGGFVKSVVDYVEDPSNGLAELPLDIRGTEFQKRVWRSLLEIPTGETSTYTDIAKKIGSPKAIRAVGNACSINNLAFAVPCHRVLHKDGSLSGGYHWGDDRQREMIKRESSIKTPGQK